MFIENISGNLINSDTISEIKKEKALNSYDITARTVDGRHYVLQENLSEFDADSKIFELKVYLNRGC